MTEQLDATYPNSDERTMAALSHFFGLIGALIIWATQKDKSRFVRFQSAQALAFDFVVILLTGALFFCLFAGMFIGIFGTILVGLNSAAQSDHFSWLMAFPVMLPFLMVTCLFPFSLAIFVARIMATISVLNGNDFRYPFLGMQVERFLAG